GYASATRHMGASAEGLKGALEAFSEIVIGQDPVNIEAIIMEVTINDRFELGVEALGLSNKDFFALSNVVSLANAIALGPLSLAGPGATIGIIDGTTEIFNPLSNTTQTFQNIPFLLRALESITDLEVLSQPNLLTVDNEEAEINVGQEIPVISSLSNINSNTSFVDRGAISRQDVGVKLKVTPQIGESDFVFMKIEVEVSSAVESNVSIDVNELGPTLQKSNIVSNVVIGHGQTGVIGGLIRETRERSVSQVPLLGDLPFIGWLGRNKTTGRTKQNLVVLVTPHVIRRGEDLAAVTDFRTHEFYAENLDVIFQKGGFIKKIKRKHHKRERYHPTHRYAPDEDGSLNFARGISSSTAPERVTEVTTGPEPMEAEPELSEEISVIEPMQEIEPSSRSTEPDPAVTFAESTERPVSDEEDIVVALPEETGVVGWFELEDKAMLDDVDTEGEFPEMEPEFSVQIGAFVNPDHATAVKARIEADSNYTAEVSRSSGSDFTRVLVGRFSERVAAETLRDTLRETPGFRDCFVMKRDTGDVASAMPEDDASSMETAQVGAA
ncbi:MAG: SPOR domain-containing protein, partial [Candidatus Hydrogenedentes bacterium]|nr:SPOR domain-containing protein [Candidatus Hydrogenedentota bacterium]